MECCREEAGLQERCVGIPVPLGNVLCVVGEESGLLDPLLHLCNAATSERERGWRTSGAPSHPPSLYKGKNYR